MGNARVPYTYHFALTVKTPRADIAPPPTCAGTDALHTSMAHAHGPVVIVRCGGDRGINTIMVADDQATQGESVVD